MEANHLSRDKMRTESVFYQYAFVLHSKNVVCTPVYFVTWHCTSSGNGIQFKKLSLISVFRVSSGYLNGLGDMGELGSS